MPVNTESDEALQGFVDMFKLDRRIVKVIIQKHNGEEQAIVENLLGLSGCVEKLNDMSAGLVDEILQNLELEGRLKDCEESITDLAMMSGNEYSPTPPPQTPPTSGAGPKVGDSPPPQFNMPDPSVISPPHPGFDVYTMNNNVVGDGAPNLHHSYNSDYSGVAGGSGDHHQFFNGSGGGGAGTAHNDVPIRGVMQSCTRNGTTHAEQHAQNLMMLHQQQQLGVCHDGNGSSPPPGSFSGWEAEHTPSPQQPHAVLSRHRDRAGSNYSAGSGYQFTASADTNSTGPLSSDVGILQAQVTALMADNQKLLQDNQRLKKMTDASDSLAAELTQANIKLQCDKDEFMSRQAVGDILAQQLKEELIEMKRQVQSLEAQVQSADRLSAMLAEEKDKADSVIRRHKANAERLAGEMTDQRAEIEAERAEREEELVAARMALAERQSAFNRGITAPMLKACLLDHILEKGNVQLPPDCELLTVNPCLTTGWVFRAFTAGCAEFGYSDIIKAIERKGVTVGFHGTPSMENVANIFCTGFDPSRRSGQAYGAGEYFDQDMSQCWGYAKGCAVMVTLLLKQAPKPSQGCPDNWKIVTNPPKSTNKTYCFPVMALRKKDPKGKKPRIPGCKNCKRR